MTIYVLMKEVSATEGATVRGVTLDHNVRDAWRMADEACFSHSFDLDENEKSWVGESPAEVD